MNELSKNDSNIIKGVAIILMMFHHLFRLASFSKGYNTNFFPFTVNRMARLCTFFKICVSLFVFITGYGLLKNYKKNKNRQTFFIQRYFKIISPFWFVAIIYFIYTQLYNGKFINFFFSKNIYTGIFNVLINFLGLSGLVQTANYSGNWWYVGAALVFVFMVPLIYTASKKFGWFNTGLAIVIIPRILGISNFSTTTATPFIFTLYLGMLAEDTHLISKISTPPPI